MLWPSEDHTGLTFEWVLSVSLTGVPPLIGTVQIELAAMFSRVAPRTFPETYARRVPSGENAGEYSWFPLTTLRDSPSSNEWITSSSPSPYAMCLPSGAHAGVRTPRCLEENATSGVPPM